MFQQQFFSFGRLYDRFMCFSKHLKIVCTSTCSHVPRLIYRRKSPKINKIHLHPPKPHPSHNPGGVSKLFRNFNPVMTSHSHKNRKRINACKTVARALNQVFQIYTYKSNKKQNILSYKHNLLAKVESSCITQKGNWQVYSKCARQYVRKFSTSQILAVC